MLNYTFFIIIIFLNIIFFNLFLKNAKKLGFEDRLQKFDNPITLTSAGIIIYLNLLTIFIIHIFFDENFNTILPNNFLLTFIALSFLVFLSAIDDIKPIDPKIRLIFQLICVYFSTTSIPIYEIDLPLKISIFLCLCVWVYIINITNFTDGSDGFLGINSFFLYVNLILINNILNLNLFSTELAIFLLPSIIIFLYFNKPKAKLYMGDSGSILIGFVNGYIFLELFTTGLIILAMTVLIYPLLDCSLGLARKALEGKMPWVDTSNYSFLQPTIKKNNNKFFVFNFNILFNILNSLLIFFQLIFGWYIIFLNVLLVLIFMIIYEKKN